MELTKLTNEQIAVLTFALEHLEPHRACPGEGYNDAFLDAYNTLLDRLQREYEKRRLNYTQFDADLGIEGVEIE